MRANLPTALFAVAALLPLRMAAAQRPEPCTAEIKGAFLIARFEQISLTGNALRLLNGNEDPKLKRLLTFQLAAAAADARRHIEEGANIGDARLTNLPEALKRVTSYVAQHENDLAFLSVLAKGESTVYPPNGRHLDRPAENLAVISAWLAKRQDRVRR